MALIDAEQEPSLGIHRRLGFVPVAHLREVGYKFGRWLDVIYMQLML
jgi:phosphinothricin acetyltransferase